MINLSDKENANSLTFPTLDAWVLYESYNNHEYYNFKSPSWQKRKSGKMMNSDLKHSACYKVFRYIKVKI